MNALADFHFLRPWWLLALLALPLLTWLLRRGGDAASLRRLVDARLLPFLVESAARRRLGWSVGAVLAWTLASLALAGPTWQRLPQPVLANRSAQVIVVSMSRRMLAQDQAPNRLTRVRYKIHALLHANRAGQNGLIAYAGAAFTVAPLTRDANALTDLLDALAPDTMPVDGDDAAAGIRHATRLLNEAGMHHGSIVVIDDHADAGALEAARAARTAGMRVSVLGAGTRKGAPIPAQGGGFVTSANGQVRMARRDDASLRALAAAGGGRYVVMSAGHGDIDALANQLPAKAGMRDARHKITVWRDNGAWLLLPLLLLMAMGFRRGALLVLPLLLLPLYPSSAHAASWKDAWRTRDQQAARALVEGHARQAERLARDPALRGTAAYRAGDFAAAAKAFARAPGAVNLYNRGNALARMHRYHDAVKAYDRALSADPKLADARANRKAVLDWLRKQHPAQEGDGHGARGHGGGKPKAGAKSSPQDRRSGEHDRGSGRPNQAGRTGKHDQGREGQGAKRSPQPSSAGSSPGQAADQGANPKTPSEAKSVARARAALKKQLDRQLRSMRPYDLGRAQPQAKGQGKPLPEAMRQALQQVPDDPGGLLRNKFMLEYQRRLQRGDASDPAAPEGGS